MGRRKQYVTTPGRLEPDQAEAIRRLAVLHDRPAAWILRRLVAIGLERFAMPSSASTGTAELVVNERGNRAAQDEGADA